MRQRVGLARALATDADILIMDEAFSALDPLIRNEMQDELLRLQQTLHKTILFITHDFQEALKIGTRIAIMSEGKVVREGTPQSIVLEPGSDYVAAFTRDVDRARLFDAASVMSKFETLVEVPQGIVVGAADLPHEAALLLDADAHVIGAVSGADVVKARSTGGKVAPSSDFVCVPQNTKLVEIARSYRTGHPIGVLDDGGRLVGLLDAEQILARIGSMPMRDGDGGRDAAG